MEDFSWGQGVSGAQAGGTFPSNPLGCMAAWPHAAWPTPLPPGFLTHCGSFPRALSVSEAGSLSPIPSIATTAPLCCPLLHAAKDASGSLSAQCPGRGSQSLPEAACRPLCWPSSPAPICCPPPPTPAHGAQAGPVHPELLRPPMLRSRTSCPQACRVPGMGGCSEAHPTDGPCCLGAHGGGVWSGGWGPNVSLTPLQNVGTVTGGSAGLLGTRAGCM